MTLSSGSLHARIHRAVFLSSLPLLLAWISFYFAFFSLFLSLFLFNFPIFFFYFLVLYLLPNIFLLSVVPQSPSTILVFPSSSSPSFPARFFLLHFRNFLYCPTPSNSSVSSPFKPLTAQSALCLCLFTINLFTVHLFTILFVYSSFTAALITKLRLAECPARGMR